MEVCCIPLPYDHRTNLLRRPPLEPLLISMDPMLTLAVAAVWSQYIHPLFLLEDAS